MEDFFSLQGIGSAFVLTLLTMGLPWWWSPAKECWHKRQYKVLYIFILLISIIGMIQWWSPVKLWKKGKIRQTYKNKNIQNSKNKSKKGSSPLLVKKRNRNNTVTNVPITKPRKTKQKISKPSTSHVDPKSFRQKSTRKVKRKHSVRETGGGSKTQNDGDVTSSVGFWRTK